MARRPTNEQAARRKPSAPMAIVYLPRSIVHMICASTCPVRTRNRWAPNRCIGGGVKGHRHKLSPHKGDEHTYKAASNAFEPISSPIVYPYRCCRPAGRGAIASSVGWLPTYLCR